ncbi:Hint domain-containing protein [Gluconacetobacter entanii]|uniref:Hint domain-containing protein n=1 Tax=Gluconacetobacter entanii TaxID=108528 RepID=A0ABT3K5S0_9PROT|nr:Hint domain-containing protein [Gluconacetobacter entanii]MCW4590763.1 Hint domain-containing protein [Gluconacetobacter entanii]MCW4594232.1 Hint domain-containing protein [Gluconacetobacter entanii]NPC89012.1 Hint domain-containing protein [Gluconacetobacter entanii]
MTQEYTDYSNKSYTLTTNSNGYVSSSQIFAAQNTTTDGDGNPVFSVDNINSVNSDGPNTPDPGFTNGTNTMTLNSLYENGVNAGFVTATTTGANGGQETALLQQTPYSTSDGVFLYAPSQSIDDTVNGQVAQTESSGTGGAYLYFTNTAATPMEDVPSTVTASSNGNDFTPAATAADVPCFTTGTPILTPRGDVAVEDLRVGDEVVTASGAHRRIRWIGHRRIACRSVPAHLRHTVLPVRIGAHAIAPGVPARDIVVSPGHAIALDVAGADVFVPASVLVNGATITQDDRVQAHYWHVELDSHDVLLSAGLRSESFMDIGNRHDLAIGAAGLDPERTAATLADYALPFHDAGAVVATVRARLLARARALGWDLTDAADLHLVVDGRRIAPVTAGGLVHFTFPATARHVTLHSATFRPADLAVGGPADARALGVNVRGAWMGGATLGLDHPLLAAAFHPDEGRDGCDWRWTTGMATLPPGLWAGHAGRVTFSLHLDHAAPAAYWHLPQAGRRVA